MAVGKPMKNSFYSESQGVKKEIAMPPLPDESTSDLSSQGFGAVPNEVPKEVYEEMNNQEESATQETQTEEVEQVEEATEDTNQDVELDKQPTKVAQNPNDSFKAIREAKERAEKERDTLMQQVMEYQQQKQALDKQYKQPEPAPVDDDIDFNIDEDGLVEGRYVKKVTNRIKNLEKQLKAYENQSNQTSTESKIKNQFPDFDKVVSQENIEMLNSQFPEIARTLGATNDLYSKAVSAYNVMKKFGIHREDPHAEDRIKAMRNTQKPKPLASVSPQQGDSPLSKANAFANGLTEDLKAQLRREMSAARKAM